MAMDDSRFSPIEARWMKIARAGSSANTEKALREALRGGGVPPSLRPRIWMALSGAGDEVKPGLYASLLADMHGTRRQTDNAQIELDLKRSGVHDETQQEALRRVLQAFSSFRPAIGYVQ